MKQVVLIVGMHRSGTSALTGAVARLGLHLGDDILPGQEADNPRGFFEHAGVVAAHDALLRSAGLTWDDPTLWIERQPDLPGADAVRDQLRSIVERETRGGSPWVVKDPRLCRLLPLWRSLLEEIGAHCLVLLIHRPPDAVASSLRRRDGFSAEKSAALWLDHVLGAERWSRDLERTAVTYEELLRAPVETLDRVGESLAIEWPSAPATRRDDLVEFLRRTRRTRGGEPVEGPPGEPRRLAEEIWSLFEAAEPGLPAARVLDRLAEATIRHVRPVDRLLLEHLGQVLERTIDTRVWRGTSPLAKGLSATRLTLDEAARDLQARLAALEGGLSEVAGLTHRIHDDLSAATGASVHGVVGRVPEICAELEHQGSVLERTRRELGELGGEVAAVAAALDGLSRQVQAAVAGQEEVLAWLSTRIERLESRPVTLAGRLRAWRDRRRG